MAVHCIIERILIQNTAVMPTISTSKSIVGKTLKESTLVKRFILTITEMIPGWPFVFGYILKLIVRHILLRLLILENELFVEWKEVYYDVYGLFQLNDESITEMITSSFHQILTID